MWAVVQQGLEGRDRLDFHQRNGGQRWIFDGMRSGIPTFICPVEFPGHGLGLTPHAAQEKMVPVSEEAADWHPSTYSLAVLGLTISGQSQPPLQ